MRYTREQIEAHEQNAQSLCDRLGFQQHGESAAIIRQLLAENDVLRENADRWRELYTNDAFVVCDESGDEYRKHLLDQVIDAARKKGQSNV